MGDAGRLLTIERDLERSFADEEQRLARVPVGWPPAVIFFHVAQWRERLRSALAEFAAGRQHAQPGNVDEINDREIPMGHDLPLSQVAARAESELSELIQLYAATGDREFRWTLTSTTGDAVVRNSYFHPRLHISAYWRQNGDERRAHQLLENTVVALRELWPSPFILGTGLYNLATARVAQGRNDEALGLLEEARPMRPDIVERAASDADLAALRGHPRFERLARPGSAVEGS